MEKKSLGRGQMMKRMLEHTSFYNEESGRSLPKGRAAAFCKTLDEPLKPFRGGFAESFVADESCSSSGNERTPESLSSSTSSLYDLKSETSSGFGSSDKESAPVGKGRAKYIIRDVDLDEKMGKLKVSKAQKMEVPDDEETVIRTGTSGQTVDVLTNYIRLDVEPGRGVYQYDVSFSPEVDSRFMRIKLLKSIKNVTGEITMFDGHILYLPLHLQEKDMRVRAEMPTDGSKVTIRISFVKKLTTSDSAMIHLYNILFRKVMNKLGLVLHGQNYFDPNASKSVPQHKLELWPGWITAIHEYEGGIMLCCDSSFRVLRTQTVLEQMEDIEEYGGADWKKVFNHNIVGQMVITRYNNKIYQVDDINFDASPMDEFTRFDKTKMTYIDYYKSQYDITIKNRRQPLLISRMRSKIKGQEDQMVNLIPELCFLSGITDEIRSDVRVMKDVTTHTRISPEQRQQVLKKFISNIKSNEEILKIFKDWGLMLSSDSVSLKARRLAPENIHFGRNAVHKGTLTADWSRSASTNHALSCVEFSNWIVICTGRDRPNVEGFITMAMRCGHNIGIKIDPPKLITIPNDMTRNYIREIRNAYDLDRTIQLIVTVFPNNRNDKYLAVKRMCCVDTPVPTQVILARTIARVNNLKSICEKIVMQMNCKLGGALWTVEVPMKKSMILGMDTYHDPTRKNPSVCALVGSLDHDLTHWYSKVYRQHSGTELNDGLELLLLKTLTKYREVNGFYPVQIILYRDGVGDGDIKHCREHEITQILTAFNRISPDYKPKFLCVIAQKRIHTRIFNSHGKSLENPSPGTIVDHTVTKKSMYDFYLVSVYVKQGTVTPTHYVVVHNTTNLTPDQVQRFTFKMTHLYYNWCGTIRSPAPCQYAHKLAKLIGEQVGMEASESLSDKLYFL